MAKNKKKGGRQGLFSKVSNVALILLAFAKPLQIWFSGATLNTKINDTVIGATGGFASAVGTPPGFSFKTLLGFYSPAIASLSLGALKRYLMKKFPVRR